MSRYSNEIESFGLKNVRIIATLLRKRCENNKHFAQLAPQNGGTTATIDMIWGNYVTVTLRIFKWIFGVGSNSISTAVIQSGVTASTEDGRYIFTK